MDKLKEAYDESDKEEVKETNVVEQSDKEAMDVNRGEFSGKEATKVIPCEPPSEEMMEVSTCERSDKEERDVKSSMNVESSNKGVTEISSNEPLEKETMEVVGFQPSDKDRSFPSDELEKDDKLQCPMKTQIEDSKFKSTKRTFKEICGAPESPDSIEDSLSAKKLILEVSGVTEDSSSTKYSEKSENLPAASADYTYASFKTPSLNDLLNKPGPSTSSNTLIDAIFQSETVEPRVKDNEYPFPDEKNLDTLFVTNGPYYNKMTDHLYAEYIKDSKKYEEVRNPRSLYSNAYKGRLGLKYFPFPFSHILIKDLLDLIDFFSGTDAYRVTDPSDTEYAPDEWELQFMRPYFETSVQHLEATVLDKLEAEFDKLSVEKLFGPRSCHQLDDSFFRLRSTESKELKWECKFEPALLEADLEFTVIILNYYNSDIEDYYKKISHCMIAFLQHINLSKSPSVELDAARLTMALIWMLRKLLKLRKTITRLLKMKGKNYSCLSTCYILKVKYHAAIYFQALLMKILGIFKDFGFEPKRSNESFSG